MVFQLSKSHRHHEQISAFLSFFSFDVTCFYFLAVPREILVPQPRTEPICPYSGSATLTTGTPGELRKFLWNIISNIKVIHFHCLSSLTKALSYPVCEEYTFCSHLFPENAMCLVFMMTTWSPQSPGFKRTKKEKKDFGWKILTLRKSVLGYLQSFPKSKEHISEYKACQCNTKILEQTDVFLLHNT